RRVGDQPAVAEKMMLVEQEAFPAELLGQFHLLEQLAVVNVVGPVGVRKVSRQHIDEKAHGDGFSRGVPARSEPGGGATARKVIEAARRCQTPAVAGAARG